MVISCQIKTYEQLQLTPKPRVNMNRRVFFSVENTVVFVAEATRRQLLMAAINAWNAVKYQVLLKRQTRIISAPTNANLHRALCIHPHRVPQNKKSQPLIVKRNTTD